MTALQAAGADTLIDNDADDTFVDTAAGLNGDTITSFCFGDKIIISNANINSSHVQSDWNTLSYSGGVAHTECFAAFQRFGCQRSRIRWCTSVPVAAAASMDPSPISLTTGYWNEIYRWNVAQGGTITVKPWTATLRARCRQARSDQGHIHRNSIPGSEQRRTDPASINAVPDDGAFTESFILCLVMDFPADRRSHSDLVGGHVRVRPGGFGYETM